MARVIRIGIAQMDCRLGEVEENLRIIEGYIERARQEEVQLLLFPELALTGYSVKERFHEVATKLDSEPIQRLQELSKRGVALAVGIIEETPGAEFYNSAIYISNGKIRHLHRKIYLPTYGRFDERLYFGAGKDLAAFDTKFARMAMLVCADCWHINLPYLAVHDGADVLLVLAASSRQGLAGEVHPSEAWHSMIHSYGLCMGSFVIFANRAGQEGDLQFWGGSRIVAPDGSVISEGKMDEPDLVVGDIDLDMMRKMRIILPFRRDDNLEFTLDQGQQILRRRRKRALRFISELEEEEI